MANARTPTEGARLRMEQHDLEYQIKYALSRAAGWLYDRMGVTEVTRKEFIGVFVDVVRAEEPGRFAETPLAPEPGAIMFDGDRGRAHPYLDATFDRLGIRRVFLPDNCVMWIHTHPHVAVYTYTISASGPISKCLYPTFKTRRTEEPPVRTRERGVREPKPKEFSWIRILTRRLFDR